MLSETEVVDKLRCNHEFMALAISSLGLKVAEERDGVRYFDEADVNAFENELLLIKDTTEMDIVELRSPSDLH